jgi:hypothetical protein
MKNNIFAVDFITASTKGDMTITMSQILSSFSTK